MAVDIKLKRSSVPGKIPTISSLELGEIALNTYDGKAYMKKQVGSIQSIVEIGSGSGGSTVSASYALNAGTANNATTSSYSLIAANATSASYVAGVVYISGSQTVEGAKTFNTNTFFTRHLVLEGSGSNNYSLNFRQPTGSLFYYGDGYTSIGASGIYDLRFNFGQTGGNYKQIVFHVGNLTLNTVRSFQFPDKAGTLLIDDITTGSVATASLALSAVTASYFSGSISNAISASYASASVSASYASSSTSASYAATASYAGNFTVAGTLTAQTLVVQVITSSQELVTGSLIVSGSLNAYGGVTGSLLGTASWANNAISASYANFSTSASYASSSTSASYALNATSASFASAIADNLNITASNILVNNNLVVNGTASFNYVQTVTGSAIIIGEEYIILNTQQPAARFAGLQIYDSGSNSTSSIVWDSERNHLVYQNASGASYSGGGFMSGPRNTGSLGDETYPTLNRILRGQGGDHLYNSNISDNDTKVSIFINTEVTGGLIVTAGITGSLQGTASWADNATTASYALIATSASYASASTSASYASTSTSASYASASTSASYAVFATSASYASASTSASYASASTSASYAVFATSASYASASTSASYASASTSASYAVFATSASFATQANSAFTASSADNFTVRGTLTAQTIIVQTITSSISVVTGSMTVSGALNVLGGITGSLLGTASRADNATSASYALTSTSASYANNSAQAQTASYVLLAISASYASASTSASYAVNSTSASFASNAAQAQTASYVLNAVSASYSNNSTSASYALNTTSASYALTATSASFASTANSAPLYLPLAGGTMTGNITFTDDQEGIVWSRNSDGASIRFYNTGDSDTDSRLEFNTLDNNDEYFRWTHTPSGGSLYESMRLVANSANNAVLTVSGKIIATSLSGSLFGTASWATNALSAISSSYSATSSNAAFSITASHALSLKGITNNNVPLGNSNGSVDSSLIYQSSGNIGINTTAPESILHVVKSSSAGLGAQLILDNNASSAAGNAVEISFLTDAGASGTGTRNARIRAVNDNAGNGAANMQFWTWDGSTDAERVRIANNGNVGINTTTTTAGKLVIETDTRKRAAFTNASSSAITDFTTGSTGIVFSRATDGSDNLHSIFAYESSTNHNFALATRGNLVFAAGGTGTYSISPERMRITSDGNVGIGTTSPSGALHVSTFGKYSYFESNANGTYPANIQGISFGWNASAGGGETIIAYNKGGGNTGGLVFANNDGGSYAERMRITSGGNVGIGTTSPGAKLAVVGDAVINTGLVLFQNDYASGNVYYPTANFINTRGNHSYGIVAAFRTNTAGDGDRPSILFYGAQATSSWQVGQVTNGWGTADAFGIGYRASNTPGTFAAWPTNYFTILTGGNVGIGTTSPATALDVAGKIRSVNTNDQITIKTSSTTGTRIGHDASGLYFANDDTSLDVLRIFGGTAGSQRLTINSSGNVGIGTSSPSYKLYVTSTASIIARFDGSGVAADSATEIDVLGPQSNGEINLGVGGSTFTDSTNNIQNKAFITATSGLSGLNLRSDAGFVQITAGGVAASNEVARFTSGGSVGIGTTSPSVKLDVNGNILTNSTLYAGSTASTRITVDGGSIQGYFSSEGNARFLIGRDIYTSGQSGIALGGGGSFVMIGDASVTSGTAMAFAVGASSGGGPSAEKMRITSAGSVGIGTTSPSYLLHVNGGDIGTSGNVNVRYTGNETYKGTFGWNHLQLGNNGQNDIIAGRTATGGYLRFIVNNTGSYSYDTYDGILAMTILSNGNVGIGSTSPSRKLDVAGAIRTTDLRFQDTAYITADDDDSGSNPIVFRNGATGELMRITSGGNVGIGTTSPINLLHLQNGNSTYSTPETTNVPNLYIYNSNSSSTTAHSILTLRTNNTGGGNPFISFDVNQITGYSMGVDNADSDKFKLANNWSSLSSNTLLTVTTGGNVGIGTTAPSQLLDVRGKIYSIASGTDGGEIRLANSGGGSTWYWAARTTGLNLGELGASDGRIFIANGGNVGIGTTSPSTKFVTYLGAPSDTMGIFLDTDGTGGAAGMGVGSSVGPYIIGNTKPDGTVRGAYGGSRMFFNASGFSFDYSSTTSGARSWSTYMTINTGGNVGIGTTSPQTRLAVGNGSLADTNVPLQISSQGNATQAFIGINKNGGYGLLLGYNETTGSLSGIGAYIRQISTDPLHFAVNNTTTAMTILSGGNVGIGSTSPSYKLDVNGVTRFQDIVRFKVNAWNLSDDNFNRFYFSSGGRTFFGSGNGYEWRSDADGALMVLTNAGNVGIGTTSPSAKLTIGSVTLSQSVSALDINAAGSGTYQRGIRVLNSSMGNGDGILMQVGKADNTRNAGQMVFNHVGDGSTSNYLEFGLYAVDQILNVVGTGRVGIGTTSPGAKLDVYASSGWNPVYTTSNTIYAGIVADSAAAGLDVHWSSGNPLRFSTSTAKDGTSYSEKMRITSGGNVGIGTTSPTTTLHVAGGIYNSSLIQTDGNIYISNNGGRLYFDRPNGATVGAVGWHTDDTFYVGGHPDYGPGAGNNVVVRGFGSNLILGTNATDYVWLNNSGNVGIGTSSPQNTFVVNGSQRSYNGSSYEVVKHGTFSLNDGTAGNFNHFITIGTTNVYATSVELTLSEVNIGHSVIKYTIVTNYDDLNETVKRIVLPLYSTNPRFENAGGSYGGAVHELQMWSDGSGTMYLRLVVKTIGSGATPNWYWTAKLKNCDITDTPNSTGNDNANYSIYRDTQITQRNGNVGIGTTNPGEKLEVVGGNIVIPNGFYYRARYNTGLATPQDLIGMNSSNIIRVGDFTNSWNTNIGGSSAIQFLLGGNTERMRIQSDGNIGIGTTSPTTILHIENSNSSYSNPGSTNVPSIYLNNTQASSTNAHSILTLRTNGNSGGNPFISFDINGVQGYAMGIDNADSDKFKINYGWSSLNSDTKITLTTGGNVGIGSTSPSEKLDISGTGDIKAIVQTTSSGAGANSAVIVKTAADGYWLMQTGNAVSSGLRFYDGTAGSERMRITSAGDVLVNATATTQGAKFYVNGIGAFGSVYVGALGTGTVYSNAGFLTNTNPSDRRLKTNIIPLTYGLADILKLNPISYNWKDGTNGKQFGFIAQEVQEVMPDAVKPGEYLGLEKDAIYSALVNSVKELNKTIKEQQRQIDDLKYLLQTINK